MSNDSTSTFRSAADPALLVRDIDGQYRPARADEVLQQARRLLSRRVRRGATMTSPGMVKDDLLPEIGGLGPEVFGVLFLDAQHHIIAFKPMFRGTVTPTSVYPREVVKEALALVDVRVLDHLVGGAEPSSWLAIPLWVASAADLGAVLQKKKGEGRWQRDGWRRCSLMQHSGR